MHNFIYSIINYELLVFAPPLREIGNVVGLVSNVFNAQPSSGDGGCIVLWPLLFDRLLYISAKRCWIHKTIWVSVI